MKRANLEGSCHKKLISDSLNGFEVMDTGTNGLSAAVHYFDQGVFATVYLKDGDIFLK